MAVAKQAKRSSGTRLRIRVQAYDSRTVDTAMRQIIDAASRLNVRLSGPVPLPTKIKKYTVNRAPFVFKDAREQMEMRVHTRIVDISQPSPTVIESLSTLPLAAGVSVEAQVLA